MPPIDLEVHRRRMTFNKLGKDIRALQYVDVIVVRGIPKKECQIQRSCVATASSTTLQPLLAPLYIPCQANGSSSISNACSRCFQASHKILLPHFVLGSEQCLPHWVFSSIVAQTLSPLPDRTCRNTLCWWTRPCAHSRRVNHRELRMQASSSLSCTSGSR